MLEDLTQETSLPVDAGHDDFVRRKIQRSINAQKNGTATFKTIDEIANKFGV